ncbi:Ribonuclease/ribotoxin [Daldinia eschscholtzii]|nr:Ribonuclease/ribotoxin [Daldinia eschscholtzii]
MRIMQFADGLVFLPLAALIASIAAAPIVEDRAEQAATTCGSTHYTATQVNQAAQKACSYYSSGSAPGGYPHTYNNYEGFSFSVSGPYLEFPLLSSGSVYTGG